MQSPEASNHPEIKSSILIEDKREKIIGMIFECLFGLSNITDELSRKIETLTGLNRNQALAIKLISSYSSIRVSDLARRMRLNPVHMVRILDHLEEMGLVTRIRSTKDRRVVEIGLTEKARMNRLILRKIINDSVMQRLSKTGDRELMQLLVPLNKLHTLLDVEIQKPSIINNIGQISKKFTS